MVAVADRAAEREASAATTESRLRPGVSPGAIGDVLTVRAREAHSGPHADHFWNADLAGDGVRLRPWREEDVPALARGLGDPDVVRWGGGSTATSEDDALRFLHRLRRRADEGSTVSWAVEVDGVVVGATRIRSVNRVDRHASVAYWVLPEHRCRGIATAALRATAGYGVGEDGLGLHRLQLQHAIGNDASCRVAEKAGFVLESGQRESFLLHGTFVDEHQHVRLASS